MPSIMLLIPRKITIRPTTAFYLIPVVILIAFVIIYGVRVPHWDEWAIATIFEKIAQGKAGLSDFAEIYNDHRYFFLRLIIVPLAFISGWEKIYEILIGVLFAILNGMLIVKISRQCYPDISHSRQFHIINGLSCLILFSLGQYQNWLWGLQLGIFLVNLCVTTSLWVLNSPPAQNSLILATLPILIASFTLAQGIIAWLAILPTVFLSHTPIKSGLKNSLIWLGLFAITTAVYLLGYDSNNPSNFNLLYLLNHPVFWVRFFVTLLGAPLGFYSVPLANILGVLVLFSFGGAIAWGYQKNGFQFLKTVAPWISLALFALLFAAITTFGRVEAALFTDLGLDFALSSRYISNSLFLWVAVLQIGLYFANGEVPLLPGKRGLTGVAIVIIFLTAINSVYAINEGQEYRQISQQITRCLKVIQVWDDRSPHCWHWFEIIPSRDRFKQTAIVLNDLGFIDSPQLQFIKSSENYGAIVWDNSPGVFSQNHENGWIILHGKLQLNPQLVNDNNQLMILSRSSEATAISYPEIDQHFFGAAIETAVFNLYENTSIQAWIKIGESSELLPLAGETQIKVVLDGIPNPGFNRQPESIYGYINLPLATLTLNPGDRFMLNGWAAFGDRDQQPDRVFFSYSDQDFFFADTAIDLETPQVAEYFHSDRYSKSGWIAELSAPDIPPGETTIHAWVYDPDRGEFVTLQREIPLIILGGPERDHE
ncbi:MAG: hypothetical protein ABWU13_04680 [Limnospira maxima]